MKQNKLRVDLMLTSEAKELLFNLAKKEGVSASCYVERLLLSNNKDESWEPEFRLAVLEGRMLSAEVVLASLVEKIGGGVNG